jgi:flap endonuclease-1
MGVDLGAILEKEELSLSELKGRYAVDAFNTLYQFLATIRQKDGTPLMDQNGHITSHLSGLFYRTCNLLERGINPVYVFDGEPHPLKKATIAARAEARTEAEEQLRAAKEEGRTEDYFTYAQRTARLTGEQIEESKRLLDALGVAWVAAPGEGEAECAFLNSQGLVGAAGSQDYDSLLFGAPTFIRNLTVAGRRKLPRREQYVDVLPERFLLEQNLTKLGLTRQQLVWLALLVGTDFNAGVHGIGPKKGLKLVQSGEPFPVLLSKVGASMDWEELEGIFLRPNVAPVDAARLRARAPDREAVLRFMVDERDFSAERVGSTLDKICAARSDQAQSSLSGWT